MVIIRCCEGMFCFVLVLVLFWFLGYFFFTADEHDKGVLRYTKRGMRIIWAVPYDFSLVNCFNRW